MCMICIVKNIILQRFIRAVKMLSVILSWWIHVIIHLSKPIECTTPRTDSNVKYGFWLIMMCQGRFISCNKCARSLFLLNFSVNLKLLKKIL